MDCSSPRHQGNYTLASTKNVHLQRLSAVQKLTKALALGLPHAIPEEDLVRLCNIASAERLKNREGCSTKTILCTFSGTVPEHFDLGPFGKFRTRSYVPEPMRCYNCQRYGHHKAQCQQGHKCAVCSGRHETSVCIANTQERARDQGQMPQLPPGTPCLVPQMPSQAGEDPEDCTNAIS